MLALTVWPVGAWRDALPTLLEVHPHAIQLHADAGTLATKAPIARAIRDEFRSRALGEPEIWLGVANDAGYLRTLKQLSALAPGDEAGRTRVLDGLRAYRMQAVDAALAIGAKRIVWNSEARWKSTGGVWRPGFDGAAATELVAATRVKAPGLIQLATSFDCPGYHAALCWTGWDAVDEWLPQVYFGANPGQPHPRRAGRTRYALHSRMWSRAVADHWLVDRRPGIYLQGHDCDVLETCFAADQASTVAMWATPSRWDADATLACKVLMSIERAGFTGAGRIARWQEANGLTPDGLIGARSLAKLGLAA